MKPPKPLSHRACSIKVRLLCQFRLRQDAQRPQAVLSKFAQGMDISQASEALAVLPLTGSAVEIAAVNLRLSAEPIRRNALAQMLAEARSPK